MVKIGIAILLIGLAYSYGVHAQDSAQVAQVESIDVSDNKDLGVSSWMPRMPPMPPMLSMPPMLQNIFDRMPPFPRIPNLDDIKNMAPNDEHTQVFGSGASFSSSQKMVNGELVEDKHSGKIVTNNNGEVQVQEFGNDQ